MRLYRKAFYPGRFQPPHWGHVLTVVKSASIAERVVIGVRRTECSEKNPLSSTVRVALWKRIIGMLGLSDRASVIIIPDVPCKELPADDKMVDHPLVDWARRVADMVGLDKSRDVVVASKPHLAVAFILAGYTVTPAFTSPEQRMAFSATMVRSVWKDRQRLAQIVPYFIADEVYEHMMRGVCDEI